MSAYSITFVHKASDIPDELWTECFSPAVEGRWWYDAMESSGLEDQFEFSYALIYDELCPVGIAPLFVMNVPIELVVPPAWVPLFNLISHVHRAYRYQRTLFVGSPCADEGMVGLLPGVHRLNALMSLQAALVVRARQLGAPMLAWKDFPSAYEGDLRVLAVEAGMFRLESFPGTIVELPGSSHHDYYAALRARHRSNLRRKKRRGDTALPVDVEVLYRPDAVVLDRIFALFWQTYERAVTRFERLNRRLFDRLASCPQSRFIILRERASGNIISFMLCFLLDGKAINKFIGIDYSLSAESFLYCRLWDAAVAWAYGEGVHSLQSGQTGYSAKLLLEHRLEPLANWCVHRNPAVHWVYGQVARSVSWATLDPDLARHLAAHPKTAGG